VEYSGASDSLTWDNSVAYFAPAIIYFGAATDELLVVPMERNLLQLFRKRYAPSEFFKIRRNSLDSFAFLEVLSAFALEESPDLWMNPKTIEFIVLIECLTFFIDFQVSGR
jgi:hypothetical protein